MSDVSEYLLDADKHRFVFKALRYENAEMAKPGEFVVDTANGIMYVKADDGTLKSKAADVAAELQSLKDAGVIQAALAYENNCEVYSLYVRENKCKISEMLKISKNCRYYAVRGTTVGGVFQYITGNLVNGQIENVLVDIDHDTTDPLIVYTGTAGTGTLHTPAEVLDGHPYFIDFFDANRVIIATVPCQVIYTAQLDFALSPEKNIISLSISSNQDMIDPATGDSVSFLYQGQDVSALNFYVNAQYADGSTRFINHELSVSRLVLEIPTDANADNVGDTFNVSAKYFTEELNTGEEGSYNDVNYASITGSRKVIVVEDVYVGVKYLLPVPLVRSSEGIREIFPKVFAFYANKSIEDVTVNSRLSISNGFYPSAFGANMVFSIALGLGNGGSVYTEEGINLTMTDGTSGAWSLLKVPNSPITQNQSLSYECSIAKFDSISEPGTIKMRLQKNLTTLFTTSGSFTDIGKVLDPDTAQYVVPTHFRVRSVIDSVYYHTIVPVPVAQWNLFTIEDTNDVTKKLTGFSANNNNVPYPVLVEFLKYDAINDKFITISMHPFFTQSQIIS